MDTRTGEIVLQELIDKLGLEERKFFIPMKVEATMVQMARKPPKVHRSDPCPCGSGRKLKHCHLNTWRVGDELLD